MNDWEVERVVGMLQELSGFNGITLEPDTIRWKHDNEDRFSVNRLYRKKGIEQPSCKTGPWKQV